MSTDDAMLSALTEAACGLGLAYRDRHDQATDPETEARCFEAFDRCFTAVRLAIALKLRLDREARAATREDAAERKAAEHDDAERDEVLERERAERYTERDRDRETERATFPLLLKTLNGIVADAPALPGPEPAELPTLRDLLASVGAAPAPMTAPVAAPGAAQPRPSALKARLTGSAATGVGAATLDRPTGSGPRILPRRWATGPPGR